MVVSSTEDLDLEDVDANHVFALAGLPGSGKSTAAEIIEKAIESRGEDCGSFEVSDYVRTMFESQAREEIDDNELGRWAAKKKERHGDGYFVYELAETLDEGHRPHIVISGLRSPEEADAVRNVFNARNVTVIGIWTLPDIRFERKYGATPSVDHPKYDEFLERNQREKHDWGCKHYFTPDGVSDYVVTNNDTVDDLEFDLLRIIDHEVFGATEPEDLRESPFPMSLSVEHIAQYL